MGTWHDGVLNRVAACLFATAAAVACGGSDAPARTPTGAYASCAVDADCTVTDFAGCCPCCPGAPHAIPVLVLEQQKRKCAVVDCAACKENVECPPRARAPSSSVVAKCQAGTCSAVSK